MKIPRSFGRTAAESRARRGLARPAAAAFTAAAVGACLLIGSSPAMAAPAGAEDWNPASGYTSTDRGDGTYSVPILNSDVPDVSVERIPADQNDEGRDIYYMVSTTMHLSPGAPIMKSYDLVNWEIVNYVFDRLDVVDSTSLRNGQSSYGQGQWATSIRYHDGLWYIAFNTNNLGGSYLYTTDDIENGGWKRQKLPGTYHDPSLFFDLDGTPYIFYGSGSTSAVKLSDDFTEVLESYPQIIRPSDYPDAPVGGLFEGAQVQYIDGQYYIVIITWPGGQGRQVVMFRSDELLGRYATEDGSNPYEAKGVLNSSGFAQGSLVPVSNGDGTDSWDGFFFRDNFPIGRTPGLIPATWGDDGWPVFGDNGSVPVGGAFEKHIELTPAQTLYERQKSIVVSDDFANDAPDRTYMHEDWDLPEGPDVDEALLGTELFVNGSFDEGVEGWVVNDTASISVTDDGALHVTGRETTGSGPAQDLTGRLQHGVTYDLSAKIRYDNPDGPATKQFLITARYGNGTFTNLASVTAARGGWAQLTGQFTVPENQPLDSVRLFVETPWTSNDSAQANPDTHLMDFSIDDLSLQGRPVDIELPTAAEIEPNGSRLAMQWEWNHTPDNRYWSLTNREGWLRLTTGKVLTGEYRHNKLGGKDEMTYLEEARNTLSQRTFGPRQSAETKLDISGMKDGDVAGLAAYNRGFSYVAVKRVDGVNTVGVVNRSQPFRVDVDQDAIEAFIPGTTAELGDATEVHLKADLEFDSPAGQMWSTFYYSLDGISWTKLNDRVGPQTLDGTLTHFMGHRVGLFNYATQEAGGHVDFDHYLLSDTLTAEGAELYTSDLEAAVAYAGSLDAADYPADEWDDMLALLEDANTALAGKFGTQNQIDAPERALSLQLARLGVLAEESDSAVTLEATTRCVARKVIVVTTVTNDSDEPIEAVVTTPYGTKQVSVEAGRSATQTFSTRQASIPAGTATVDADGRTVTANISAATCD